MTNTRVRTLECYYRILFSAVFRVRDSGYAGVRTLDILMHQGTYPEVRQSLGYVPWLPVLNFIFVCLVVVFFIIEFYPSEFCPNLFFPIYSSDFYPIVFSPLFICFFIRFYPIFARFCSSDFKPFNFSDFSYPTLSDSIHPIFKVFSFFNFIYPISSDSIHLIFTQLLIGFLPTDFSYLISIRLYWSNFHPILLIWFWSDFLCFIIIVPPTMNYTQVFLVFNCMSIVDVPFVLCEDDVDMLMGE